MCHSPFNIIQSKKITLKWTFCSYFYHLKKLDNSSLKMSGQDILELRDRRVELSMKGHNIGTNHTWDLCTKGPKNRGMYNHTCRTNQGRFIIAPVFVVLTNYGTCFLFETLYFVFWL